MWQRGCVTGFGQGLGSNSLTEADGLSSWRTDPWQFKDEDVEEDAVGCPKVQVTEGLSKKEHVAVWQTGLDERPRTFPFATDQFPLFKSGWTMHAVMTTLGCWDLALEMNGWQLFSRLRLHKPFHIAIAGDIGHGAFFDAITTACGLALFWGLQSFFPGMNVTLSCHA